MSRADLPFFDRLYQTNGDDRAIFGKHYQAPPESFIGGEWVKVARFEKHPAEGDGQPVEIDECRMPARFYRLRALESTNSIGDRVAPYSVTTGSGDEVGRLMVKLAKQIVTGMIGFHPEGGEE